MPYISLFANDTRFATLKVSEADRIITGAPDFETVTAFQAEFNALTVPHTIPVQILLSPDAYDGILDGTMITLTIGCGVDETYDISVEDSIGQPKLWLVDGNDVAHPMDKTPLFALLNDVQKHWLTR